MRTRAVLLLTALGCAMAWSADVPKDAATKPGQVNGLGMRFVPVPGTNVEFSVYETRVQDFRVFVRETGYVHLLDTTDVESRMWSLDRDGSRQRGNTWENPGFAQTGDHPVVGVNWRDAKAFCEWLTLRERTAGRLPEDREYRLPMDHEWSIAAGLTEEDRELTPKQKDRVIKGKYPWGEWPEGQPLPGGAGNYAGTEARDAHWPAGFKTMEDHADGFARTAPVGSFQPNRHGIYDLGGNAWEWCEDRYAPEYKNRVLRGASWLLHGREHLLSSHRLVALPGVRIGDYGFRCVIAPLSK